MFKIYSQHFELMPYKGTKCCKSIKYRLNCFAFFSLQFVLIVMRRFTRVLNVFETCQTQAHTTFSFTHHQIMLLFFSLSPLSFLFYTLYRLIPKSYKRIEMTIAVYMCLQWLPNHLERQKISKPATTSDQTGKNEE